ncbi:MAG: sulfatase [Candidatus Aegiribacteria sp.]
MFLLAIAGCSSHAARRPNVLLVLIDTLRSDHVHCYGYDREVTPTLDSLAAAGTMWTSVQGQAAWTLPAMATIFTGLTERQHLAGFRDGRLYGMADELKTLPEIFSENGYRTSGFYNVPVMTTKYGFTQGMDFVDLQGCRLAVDADVINEKFLDWLDESEDQDAPFFAVLHYFDPHYPYIPPEPWDGLFSDPDHPHTHWASEPSTVLLSAGSEGLLDGEVIRRLIDLYDGEIAFMDSELGILMEELRSRGLDGNTVVFVTADHGEEFLEHGGLLHGFTLFTEITGLPMIACGPGIEEGYVDTVSAAQIDVLPTLLGLAGIRHAIEGGGVDLSRGNTPGRILPASGFSSDAESYLTVRRDDEILFWDYVSGRSTMFDLSLDPMEQDSLEPDSSLLSEAEWYRATPPAADPDPVPGAQRRIEALRDLGYFH